MRTAILEVRHHGNAHFDSFATSSVPYAEQWAEFRSFLALSVHPEIAEIKFWTSDAGEYRVHKMRSPTAHVAHEAQSAKDTAAHLASKNNSGATTAPTATAAAVAPAIPIQLITPVAEQESDWNK